jgi:hypothetical protein
MKRAWSVLGTAGAMAFLLAICVDASAAPPRKKQPQTSQPQTTQPRTQFQPNVRGTRIYVNSPSTGTVSGVQFSTPTPHRPIVSNVPSPTSKR